MIYSDITQLIGKTPLFIPKNYIKNNFSDIKKYANIIENRLDDEYCTLNLVLEDNASFLEQCKKHNANYILIDDTYQIDIDL